jgi:predicted nucleotide-binding protein
MRTSPRSKTRRPNRWIFDATPGRHIIVSENEIPTMQDLDQALFCKIDDAVSDLMRANSETFDRYIKRFLRLLREPVLEETVATLKKGVDLEAWLHNNKHSNGMAGSGSIRWPKTIEQELGVIILLSERFEEYPNFAFEFSYEYCNEGSRHDENIRKMVRMLFSKFARDFSEHIQKQFTPMQTAKTTVCSAPTQKVFVVHGHDDYAKQAVARFIQSLGFEVIILNEQANLSQTLPEKIESHSDVGFAVVLLTPDDFGAANSKEAQPRARQNVILELGYFWAALSRKNLCVLRRGEVEVPSDLHGIILETFDENGGWKRALGRALEAADFKIDWNMVMRN